MSPFSHARASACAPRDAAARPPVDGTSALLGRFAASISAATVHRVIKADELTLGAEAEGKRARVR